MEEKKKIKMLVIPSDKFGCGLYRSVNPHVYIGEHYSDEFDVDIVYSMPNEDLEAFFKQYDLVHIHKQLDKEGRIIDLLNFLEIPVIVDIDDHFFLGNDHPMSLTAKKEKWHEPIINHLRKAAYVTTTTKIFAKTLRKYNKNVAIFPNAMDPTDEQFSLPKTPETDRLRVGIICGSSHWKDIELLEGIGKQIDLDKVQFVLCGFDTNGTRTIYHQDTGEVETRPIYPEESVWCEYEKVFTDNYNNVTQAHKDFLFKYMPSVDDPFTNEPYRRMWTRPIDRYATHYANVDVLIAPLKENDFNGMKSELKEAECGFTNTAFIAQNFGAYTINLIPMIEKGGKINENGTALLVDSSKNHKQWAKYINRLAKDRDMLHRLQKNLHEFVMNHYTLEKICGERVELYRKIVAENRANKQ